MVMKQAIQYNLAGNAENEQDEVVWFTLQGDAKRLNPAIAAIREGTKKSSNIEVATTPRLLRAECAYKGRLGIVRSWGEGRPMRLKDRHCEKARRRAMKAKLFPDIARVIRTEGTAF